MSSDRIRLFAAFDVPVHHRERLNDRVRSAASFPNARWTTIESQHVTLRFIGWAESSDMSSIAAACAEVAARVPRSDVSLSGIGVFPSVMRCRVLWAGVDDPAGTSTALADGMNERLSQMGYEGEARPYVAHLTLARFKTPQKLDGLPEVDLSDLEAFPLDEAVLYRSHLGSGGARYEALERFPLRSE